MNFSTLNYIFRIQIFLYSTTSHHKSSNQSGTSRRRRIIQSRKQVPPPISTMRIIASSSRGVHKQVPSITRVGPLSVHPRASRRGLERRLSRALEVAVAEGVGHGPSQKASQVDDHSVQAHVVVGRHQGRGLGPVNGLVEGPGALARALGLGVSDPDVSELVVLALDVSAFGGGGRAVGPALAHAEPFDCDVR
ncbi:hypothetical protein TorRG33x02_314670 [Trema orientale]|uniref:Uncharacterized protein n=1 Tax=Trema orientale TaxID=63057 RepID=A0A2P5BNF0_TREOI|nr:hypothetical protein TorRG33x02_314670 [Trema orientale]